MMTETDFELARALEAAWDKDDDLSKEMHELEEAHDKAEEVVKKAEETLRLAQTNLKEAKARRDEVLEKSCKAEDATEEARDDLFRACENALAAGLLCIETSAHGEIRICQYVTSEKGGAYLQADASWEIGTEPVETPLIPIPNCLRLDYIKACREGALEKYRKSQVAHVNEPAEAAPTKCWEWPDDVIYKYFKRDIDEILEDMRERILDATRKDAIAVWREEAAALHRRTEAWRASTRKERASSKERQAAIYAVMANKNE